MNTHLNTFTVADQQALALAALVLLNAVNDGRLIVSDQVEPVKVERTIAMLDWLYVLQDAIHGGKPDDRQKVLAVLFETEGVAL